MRTAGEVEYHRRPDLVSNFWKTSTIPGEHFGTTTTGGLSIGKSGLDSTGEIALS